MKIVDLHFFPGRNVYSHRPVMKMLLDLGSAKDFRTDSDPSFADRLLATLPGLIEHKCSRRRRGGFVERIKEGTYLGHVVEHVFLELQSQAGIGTEYGKTFTGDGCIVEIISEYRCSQAAQILVQTAVRAVESVLNRQPFSVEEDLICARQLAAQYLPGPSTQAILSAAKNRGIPCQVLDEGSSLYRLGTGKYQKRIQASITENTGCIAADIACNKPLTKKILSQHGLPVPSGVVVRSFPEAQRAALELGYPVVLKPDNGNQGKGVSLNLQSAADVARAFAIAAEYSPAVMVESYLTGRHFRFLVIHGQVAAVAERLPAYVIGDGLHSISELVQLENSNPLRGDGHEKALTKIVLDHIAADVLRRQNLAYDSVAKVGERVLLRDNANLSTGGTACDVTAIVHPRQAELAASAAKLIGLDIAGVDVVMEDITQPPENQAGGIIEVNAAPGLRMHLFPTEGLRQEVGQYIVDSLFPPDKPARVPVFSITGTNGKTTTTRMIDYVLRSHGLVTGMCCTDGVYHQGTLVKSGDLTGPAGALAVLANPEIEAAVLETARGGIIRRGLGYDLADIAVVTNIRSDHIGQDGIESIHDLIHVKSLVAEAVYDTGTVILNADEAHVHEIAERVWVPIIYTSMQEDSITVRRHLGKGGRAMLIRKGTILAAQGSRIVLVGRMKDFPVTFGGRAKHQAENLLLAIAACWGYGLSPRQAALHLKSFASSPLDNPGRANLYTVGGMRVIVDYGHNPDGFAKMGELAKKLKPAKTLAVLGVPGDRCDDLIRSAGEMAAKYFDILLIKEDEDLRGRKPGEVSRLLKQGALSAGKDPSSIHVFSKEKEALQAALNTASQGDLVLVFYEKIEAVVTEIHACKGIEQPTAHNQQSSEQANIESPAVLY